MLFHFVHSLCYFTYGVFEIYIYCFYYVCVGMCACDCGCRERPEALDPSRLKEVTRGCQSLDVSTAN